MKKAYFNKVSILSFGYGEWFWQLITFTIYLSVVAGFVRGKGDCIGSIATPVTATLQECANSCLLDQNCVSFTFNPDLAALNCWVNDAACSTIRTYRDDVTYNFLQGEGVTILSAIYLFEIIGDISPIICYFYLYFMSALW